MYYMSCHLYIFLNNKYCILNGDISMMEYMCTQIMILCHLLGSFNYHGIVDYY